MYLEREYVLLLLSSLLTSCLDHLHWPVYMSEMQDMKPSPIAEKSTIFSDFHISEYIYIRLVCVSPIYVPIQESNDLRSYNDLNRSKLLLSTAILAMRTQECPIPVFVEVEHRGSLHFREFRRVPLS